jgi:hypothetical protein
MDAMKECVTVGVRGTESVGLGERPIEARGVKEAVWNGEPLSEAVGVGARTERENSPPSETHPTAGATASITRPRRTATAFEKCEPPSHAGECRVPQFP